MAFNQWTQSRGRRAAIGRYWEYQYADYVTPGDPRTLSLNARIDF
jgi:hypothetical protein